MEFTGTIYNSYHQGYLSRDVAMQNSNSNCGIQFEKQFNAEKDALFAIKQDPAVLEAQVTISTPQEANKRSFNDNAVTAADSSSGNRCRSHTAGNYREGLRAEVAMGRPHISTVGQLSRTPHLNDQKRPEEDGLQSDGGFTEMLSMQRAALQSLSSEQFNLLLKYVDTLRKQRASVQKEMECGYCKKNGHPIAWYSTHSLKDRKGRVRCPILRVSGCRRCGASGDHAHTTKYCPEKKFSLTF